MGGKFVDMGTDTEVSQTSVRTSGGGHQRERSMTEQAAGEETQSGLPKKILREKATIYRVSLADAGLGRTPLEKRKVRL